VLETERERESSLAQRKDFGRAFHGQSVSEINKIYRIGQNKGDFVSLTRSTGRFVCVIISGYGGVRPKRDLQYMHGMLSRHQRNVFKTDVNMQKEMGEI
jgi:hypothetical protein